jgi:hypothetical protein
MTRSLLPLLGVVIMIFGCSRSQSAPQTIAAKVSVLASGKILLNGHASSLGEIEKEFIRQKASGGSVWYYRENGQGAPPPEAMAVIELVVKYGLSVSMSSRPDFSDYIDGNGESHPR